jgi:MOSC domain-containing protein
MIRAMVTVDELNIYPLKSGRRIETASVRLADTGLEWDRHWMLVDAKGTFLSQRTHPRLAWIQPELSETQMTFHAPDLPPLPLPLEPVGTALAVQVWKDPCEGLDQGEAASAWASALLSQPVRFVRVVKTPKRMADARFAGPKPMPVTFPDGFPILVCNRASLEDLNSRMPEPVPMDRFRPNLVLEGLPPFAEDRIESLQIGSVTLRLVKPCTRCVITSTDQLTGERVTNPLPVLRQFRFNRDLLGVMFGENAIPVSGVGDVIERGAECLVTYDA